MPDLLTLSTPALLAVLAVVAFAGFAHGVLGLGFALISTVFVTLLVDLRMAIVVNLVPSLATTLISMLRGGKYRRSLVLYWFLPPCVMLGSYLGARLLLVSPQPPFTLLLAVIVVVYLNVERMNSKSWAWVTRHPGAAGVALGFVAGIANSTTNVAAPPLLIYLLSVGAGPLATVQTLNLCFFTGKLVQTAPLASGGGLTLRHLAATLPLAAVAVVVMLLGMKIRERVDAATYRRWMKNVLWVIVILLVVQFFRQIR